MKNVKFITLIMLILGVLTSFIIIENDTIGYFFLDFKGVNNLTAQTPDKLPKRSVIPREVETTDGIKEISITNGYRILYFNEKGVPFVNLKVEKSVKKQYTSDKENLINNLRYLINNSMGMESKEIIELEFNGYKVYRWNLNSIEKGSTLGNFIMFPGNEIIIYFYFNNLIPEYRNFDSLEDYKKQRDNFIKSYIKHISKNI